MPANEFNSSRMTVDAAPFLALAHAGELCGRITFQSDGTPLTSHGHSEFPQRSGLWQFRIRSISGVIAGVAATLGFARLFRPPAESPNLRAPQQNPWSGPKNRILMGRLMPCRDFAPAALDVPSTDCD
jgi:hypothetical protein